MLSFRKMAAFPTIMAGALGGGLTAILLQPQLVVEFAYDLARSAPIEDRIDILHALDPRPTTIVMSSNSEYGRMLLRAGADGCP